MYNDLSYNRPHVTPEKNEEQVASTLIRIKPGLLYKNSGQHLWAYLKLHIQFQKFGSERPHYE